MAIIKYGAKFNDSFTPLDIEFWFARKGDLWLKAQGRSLFYHVREIQKILWPKDDHHRWSDLILQTYCENEISVLIGCSDSGKTFGMAKIILIDYWLFPDSTLWLVSTTEGRGSELRIWGVIKDLFNQARQVCDLLEGNPIDHLKTITTEEIDENKREARSLRRGIIIIPCKSGGLVSGLAPYIGIKAPRLRHAGDECFPAGTLVDTPSGKIPIERIRPGNFVINALGECRVKHTMNRKTHRLVKITASDGRIIPCTPNHRFFTNTGWKSALHIRHGDYMLSAYEGMSIMSGRVQTNRQQSCLPIVPGTIADRGMQTVWEKVSEKDHWRQAAILQSELQREVFFDPAGKSGEVLYPGTHEENNRHEKTGPGEMEFGHEEITGWRRPLLPTNAAGGKTEIPFKTQPAMQGSWSPFCNARREWNWTNPSRKVVAGIISSSCEVQFRRQNEGETRERTSDALQARCGFPGHIFVRGSGRKFAQHDNSEGTGRSQNELADGAWVDGVEIYEPTGDAGHAECERGVTVYNLEVEKHPSYSVNGFLVHNCAMMNDSFLNAYSNWYGKEDFKGIMSGNFMETDDPLGIAAEPIGGWDTYVDSGKTQTWRSKFYKAAVIALDGRDSPNNDYLLSSTGRTKFPYLIGNKKLAGVAESHGMDSWQWYSQCVGKPVRGFDIWRVISRDFCAKHHASDDVIWKDTNPLQLYAIDPAYGGGDRCVGRHLELGTDINDKQILLLHAPEIIPIKVNIEADAEDQIALYIQQCAKTLSLKPSNIFYDSFGRGTLGFAFAKLFKADNPVPVDSSAKPTARPVRFDLFVEEQHVKRLKRCDEHYTKFITELYFSTREAIDSEQIRGLDAETIREGSARKFTRNADSKLELETKDDYKERNRGRSPDLMDCTVIGVEGARQRGFRIELLGDATKKQTGPDWLDKEAAAYEKFQKERRLQTA